MKGSQKNQAIIVHNILRQIGLSSKLKGTKILLSAVMLALTCTDDFIILNDIYKQLSYKYKLSPKYIENAISYSLKHLVGTGFKKNFEKIFDLEFSENFYSNKTIIEEVTRVIKIYRWKMYFLLIFY